LDGCGIISGRYGRDRNAYSTLVGKTRREDIVTIIFCNDFQYPKLNL
jgi:hypothetical protein